ncbi:hypothetical protein MY818_06735 [Haemophilus influenzae]
MLITLTHINNNLIIRNEILDSLGKQASKQAKSDLNSTSQSKQIILQEINKVKENNIRKNNKIVY